MLDKKQKYKVIRKHTLDAKVGDIISLTDAQAKFLVNKVVLVGSEKVKPKKVSLKVEPKIEPAKTTEDKGE